jgi:DNA polymerase I-like protein with 3'-5' exonuclease and polymerase domains
VGADLAGLELRCLAHFMAKYDEGAYAKVLLEGDIHTVNQQAAGLPTRNDAKTFVYAFLYGAGDQKIGSIVLPDGTPEEQKRIGKKLKKSFLKKTPALRALREAVTAAAAKGYIKGLDGRVLSIRSAHAALNTLLQSAGALIAKQATVIAYDNLTTSGMVFGRDWALVAHVHDELQVECKKEIADVVGRVLVQSMQEAGRYFNFRVPIDGEYKHGSNWAETH